MLSFIRTLYHGYQRKRLRNSIVNAHHDALSIDEKMPSCDYRKQGFSLTESAIFELNKNDYHGYINTWEAYQPRLNEHEYFCISDDKYLFSLVFGQYVEVPQSFALINNGILVSLLDNPFTEDTLYDFLVRKGGGVIKDRMGCDGFDIFVFKVNEEKLEYKNKLIEKTEFKKIVKKYKNGLVQSIITQGQYASKLFPYSVNTVRIISMRKKGAVRHDVVAALQRIGTLKSAPVDNFNQGGCSALIDLETGTLGKMSSIFSVDENGEHIFYDIHPDTGGKIEGVCVPKWEELVDVIGSVTEKIPFFDYIAWDIVIKDDGFAVIETNMKSSLNVFQIHKGMRNSRLGEYYRERGYLE